MIADTELDRILTAWLSEGPQRAPADDVTAALAVVATTPQRRDWPGLGRRTRALTRTHLGLVAAALLIVLAAVAIGVGASLIELPSPPAPEPPRPAPAEVRLEPLSIADWPVRVSVPNTWTEIETPCCDYRQFAGTTPEGHLSIGHESPFRTAVCSPTCHDIELPFSIPYSAEKQLGALKRSVEAIAGSTAWTPLEPALLDQIEGGARLESTATDEAGREWRRVHIVGLRERNGVAIAWSQPSDVYDPGLLHAVLASVELTPAPTYSDGDLIDPWRGEPAFTIPLPGLWTDVEQPVLDGVAASGVRRFASGRVVVSIGDPDGTLRWCDPECRLVTGQTSLDELERTIRKSHGPDLGPAESIMLGGEPARQIGTDVPVSRRYAMAIHDRRPVVLMIDVGDWDVAPGIPEQMIGGFAFVDPEPAPVSQVFSTLDGGVELALPDRWERVAGNEDAFRRGRQRLTVRVGGDDGSIVTCGQPAGPWELCRQVQATNLMDLAAAVLPANVPDHGVGPPVPRREDGTLGGEPSVVVRIQAYEYPAKGGQEVVYVVAMHDGRPYILRIWTSDDNVADLESVIAGFRFVD